MSASTRSFLTASLLLIDILIYLPNLTTCRPAGCPEACACEENGIGEVSLACTVADVLDAVPQMPMEGAKMVVKMEIESSGLTYLAEEVFDSLAELEFLLLRQNCIQNFPLRLLQHPDVRELYLQRNPLRCNCSNAWMLNSSQIIDAVELTCVRTDTGAERVCSLNKRSVEMGDQALAVTHMKPLQEQLITSQKLLLCVPACVRIDNDVVEVGDGKEVNITCRVCNNQTQTQTTWQATDLLSNWTEMLLPAGHVLQLQNVDATDNFKLVTCVGNSSGGSSTSTARIAVLSSPTIADLDFSFSSPVLIISYNITGWPPPQIQWLKETSPMPKSWFILDTDITLNDVGVFTGSRVINPIGPNTDGLYTLIATNSEGTINRTVNVTVQEHVPVVPTLSPIYPDSLPKSVITLASTESTKAQFLWGTASVFELQVSLAVTSGLLITFLIIVLSVCIRQRLKLRTDSSSERTCSSHSGNKKCQSFPEELPLTGVHLVENPYYNRSRSKKRIQTKTSARIKIVKLETIVLMHVIGEGAFGKVYLGSCAHLVRKDEFTTVAVKTLKGESSDALKKDLKREAEVLATFEHQNIITFYGICTEGEHWMMIFEFMEHGDLNKYLRNHSPDMSLVRRGEPPPADEAPLTLTHLLQIAIQIASGMEYLAAQHFVHRDMATRNCLVDRGLVVKIGDFGMSRDVYNTDYYKVGGESVMLPIRWMPPESILYRTFTVESDVWSFGVTLWEVFTYGKQPWFEYSNSEVIEHIKRCHHLRRPHKCPESLYKVMHGCWSVYPQERLSMKEICKLLVDDALINQHEYLDILP